MNDIRQLSQDVLNNINKAKLQIELTNQRIILQKACGSYGFVSGLKEILCNETDASWRITRPPFKILNLQQQKEILDQL